MRYRRLGQSGLFVSELCLGTMTFGGSDDMWGQIGKLQQEEADGLLRTALDAGINFIDTANVYATGRSEEILGQSLRNLAVAAAKTAARPAQSCQVPASPVIWSRFPAPSAHKAAMST